MMLIADAHNDYLGYNTAGESRTELYNQADITRLKAGGVVLQNFAVWVPQTQTDGVVYGQRQIDTLNTLIDVHPNEIELCTNASQLSDTNRIRIILSVESGESIGCDVSRIKYVYNQGVRILSLTWNNENAFASGAEASGGLKDKGKHAIYELNKQNIAYDASHINEQGFWDAMEQYAHAPCATHSCVYALHNCPRNLKNNQIEHIISRGGFIGVNFFSAFLTEGNATIDDILAHIEYILARGGERVVGFGSDFCGIHSTPVGIDSSADFQKLPEAMARANYSEELIRQICYSNFAEYILKFL